MTPDQVTQRIRAEVFEKAKISISAGIAPNARVFHPLIITLEILFDPIVFS